MNITTLLIIATSVLGLLSITSVITAWIFAIHFCKPGRKISSKTPAHIKLEYQEVTFPSQGFPLKGWFIPAQNQAEPAPAIIIAHGWSSNKTQGLPIAASLNKAGYATLLYDVRSHGESPDDSPITLQKFAQDMIAAVDYLSARPDVDQKHIGAVGHSMGGGGTIIAASMDPRIKAIVSSAAFADPVEITRDYMRKYYLPRGPLFRLACFFINRWINDATMADIAPRNRIRLINRPILLLHGKADRKIIPENMTILHSNALPGCAQAHLIPGGHLHSDIIRHTIFQTRIVDFFNTHIRIQPRHILQPLAGTSGRQVLNPSGR
jgi:pimeloyl-ACP methyl ester carboxylesterase